MNCPCGNDSTFAQCCELIHTEPKKAQTAEQLMRARYSAFVMKNITFLYDTFHPNTRRFQNKKEIEQWALENRWMKLEIVQVTKHKVEFKAYYLDPNLATKVHHEKSTFEMLHNTWFYVEGVSVK